MLQETTFLSTISVQDTNTAQSECTEHWHGRQNVPASPQGQRFTHTRGSDNGQRVLSRSTGFFMEGQRKETVGAHVYTWEGVLDWEGVLAYADNRVHDPHPTPTPPPPPPPRPALTLCERGGKPHTFWFDWGLAGEPVVVGVWSLAQKPLQYKSMAFSKWLSLAFENRYFLMWT